MGEKAISGYSCPLDERSWEIALDINMDTYCEDDLVSAWIAEHKDYRSKSSHTVGWAYRELNRLCNEQPRRGLRIIQLISNADNSDAIAEILAAGPLENLLVAHGSQLIDDVCQSAAAYPRFRELLGGVWQGGIDDGVWNKLQSLIDRRW